MTTPTIEFSSTLWGGPDQISEKLRSGQKSTTIRRTDYKDGYHHIYLDDGGIVAEAEI